MKQLGVQTVAALAWDALWDVGKDSLGLHRKDLGHLGRENWGKQRHKEIK